MPGLHWALHNSSSEEGHQRRNCHSCFDTVNACATSQSPLTTRLTNAPGSLQPSATGLFPRWSKPTCSNSPRTKPRSGAKLRTSQPPTGSRAKTCIADRNNIPFSRHQHSALLHQPESSRIAQARSCSRAISRRFGRFVNSGLECAFKFLHPRNSMLRPPGPAAPMRFPTSSPPAWSSKCLRLFEHFWVRLGLLRLDRPYGLE
jgi:hypothetical protein